MEWDAAKRAAMEFDAEGAIADAIATEERVRLNSDEERLVTELAAVRAFGPVATWVQWQADGGVDEQTARESLRRVFEAIEAAAMGGYAPAEA
jgi:hypothetical protein